MKLYKQRLGLGYSSESNFVPSSASQRKLLLKIMIYEKYFYLLSDSTVE